ncbi:hypothetical protein FPQ18DRAFT_423022 [Pyronema domesticum]|nr:hypothetical protein FPQ18DRAFT_423022 [Pyronema domesticum]
MAPFGNLSVENPGIHKSKLLPLNLLNPQHYALQQLYLLTSSTTLRLFFASNASTYTTIQGADVESSSPFPYTQDIRARFRSVSRLNDAVSVQAAIDDKERRKEEKVAKRNREAALRHLWRLRTPKTDTDTQTGYNRPWTSGKLNGNSGHVTSPTAPKESFFSHLRKRNRRLSGRIGLLPSPEDVLLLPLRPAHVNVDAKEMPLWQGFKSSDTSRLYFNTQFST